MNITEVPWEFILLVFVLTVGLPTAYAGWIGAPYTPTRIRAIRRAFDELELGSDHILIDLGAGDGKIVIEAARRGATACGLELSPLMWAIAKLRALPHKRARIVLGNFFKRPLAKVCRPDQQSNGTQVIIFAFLMPTTLPKVLELLSQQHIPNAKFFLSYAFAFKDVEPLHVIREKNCSPVYVYDLKKLTGNTA